MKKTNAINTSRFLIRGVRKAEKINEVFIGHEIHDKDVSHFFCYQDRLIGAVKVAFFTNYTAAKNARNQRLINMTRDLLGLRPVAYEGGKWISYI